MSFQLTSISYKNQDRDDIVLYMVVNGHICNAGMPLESLKTKESCHAMLYAVITELVERCFDNE